MKQSNENCAKPAPAPRPNFKNKNFTNWSRAETCKKDDNIVSSEWRETLKTTNPFVPVYNNAPLCMNYLLSGEYGRIWLKERDDWYKQVFVPKGREKDMTERRNRIRRAAKAEKKKAEKEAKEYKERKAKEAEAKAKIEAEKAEKLRAKIQKCAASKKAESLKKKKKEAKEETAPETTDSKKSTCPKDWVPVELTVQCECSDHPKETGNPEHKEEPEPEQSQKAQNPEPDQSQKAQNPELDQGQKAQKTQNTEADHKAEQSCVMCGDYLQQIQNERNSKAGTEVGNQSANSENENPSP